MLRTAAALAAFSFSLTASASCGAAFCMVNTSWDAQGAWTEAGTRLDLRYEVLHQDQPRAGSDKVAVGAIPRHHDEVSTMNRNLFVTLDHAFDRRWGLSVSLPVVDREHRHVHNHQGAQLAQEWQFKGMGDLRLLGRYQLAARDRGDAELDAVGLNFGVKLPTGEFDVRNGAADLAERSLQPGTGTTDALLGAYYVRRLPLRDLSWFTQALAQHPLNTRANFRPGARHSLDLGLRYEASASLGLMLQLNLLHRSRDAGSEAEPDDTGGRFAFLSPGASWNVTNDVQLYGFLQLPVYQKVNGIQLTADRAVVIGASMRF